MSSCSLHAPILSSVRSQFVFSFHEALENKLWYKLVSSKLVVFDLKDLICSCILFYTFRIFERRLGSRKYSVSQLWSHSRQLSFVWQPVWQFNMVNWLLFNLQSYLLNNLVISSLLELVIIFFLRSFNGYDINYLTPGPWVAIKAECNFVVLITRLFYQNIPHFRSFRQVHVWVAVSIVINPRIATSIFKINNVLNGTAVSTGHKVIIRVCGRRIHFRINRQ